MLILFCFPVWAGTLPVGSGKQFPTIQQAIQQATSGDTIQLFDSKFAECLDTLGKDLTIDGRKNAIIDPGGICPFAINFDTNFIKAQP